MAELGFRVIQSVELLVKDAGRLLPVLLTAQLADGTLGR
jgi:hypothetical protein